MIQPISKWVVTPWYDEGEGYSDVRGTPVLVDAPTAKKAEAAYSAVNGSGHGDDWLDTRALDEWDGPTPEVLR